MFSNKDSFVKLEAGNKKVMEMILGVIEII